MAAINAGNADAAADLFADDAVFTLRVGPEPPEVFTGKEQIRDHGHLGGDFRFELVGSPQVEEDRVTWMAKWTNDELRDLGVTAEITFEAVVQEGKIKTFTATISEETFAEVEVAIAAQHRAESAADPLSVVNGWVEAFNAGDIAALTRYYAEDVVFSVRPGPEGEFHDSIGKAHLLEANSEHIALHGQYTASNLRSVGNTVTGEFSYTDDDLKRIGVTEFKESRTYVIDRGKIISIKATIHEKTRLEMAAARVSAIQPIWSPDGWHIAFQTRGDPRGDEIYVMRADGTEQTNLTDNRAPDCCPAWSPDSRHLAFMSLRDHLVNDENLIQIYVTGVDGTEHINLTNNPAPNVEPVWSPDGQHIAFVSWREGSQDIYVMRANGSEQTRLTNSPGPYTQRTLGLWFRTTDDVTTRQVLWEEGGGGRGLSIYVDQGFVYVNGWNLENDDFGATTPWGPRFMRTAINQNTFYHVALVFDQPAGEIRGFFDGNNFGEATAVGKLFAHGGDVNIGRVGDSTVFHDGDTSAGHFFKGLVDEVELYNRALTASEIKAIFDAGSAGKVEPTPRPPGLVSRWPGDGNANDAVGSNHGFLEHGATFATGQVGQAFSLDGLDAYVAIRNSPDINTPAGACCPVWSPDGSKVAFISTRDGNDEIYVMRADGTEQTNLSNNPGHDSLPAWSPDGEFIAFISSWSSRSEPRTKAIYSPSGDQTGRP